MNYCGPLSLAAAALGAATSASAQVTTYTSRSAFSAAAGPLTTQTFNSYTTDTSFRTTPLTFPGFTLAGAGAGQLSENFIDVPPLQFAIFNVDGTPIVNAFTSSASSVIFTFLAPITAFGADFASFQDGIVRSSIVINGQTIIPDVAGAENSNTVRFLGYTSSTPFTTVTFNGTVGDGFGIDNVSFSSAVTAAVPEPGTWALMLTGFGAVGFTMRRRQKVVTQVSYAV